MQSPRISTFHGLLSHVSVVFDAMTTDVLQFLAVFTPLLISFTTAINSIMMLHPVWASRCVHLPASPRIFPHLTASHRISPHLTASHRISTFHGLLSHDTARCVGHQVGLVVADTREPSPPLLYPGACASPYLPPSMAASLIQVQRVSRRTSPLL